MKKFVAVLVMVIMAMMVMNIAVAEFDDKEAIFGNVWNRETEKVFVKASLEGEKIGYNAWLYDDVIFAATKWGGAYWSEYGIDPNKPYREIMTKMQSVLADAGCINPVVVINPVGIREGEVIYDIAVYTETNLNDISLYNTEKIGNGYIGDGLDYYGIRTVGIIR